MQRIIILLITLFGLPACGSLPPGTQPNVGPLDGRTLSYGEAADLAAQEPSFQMTVGEFRSLAVWTTMQVNGDTCFNLPILGGGYRVTACIPPKGSRSDGWSRSTNLVVCEYRPEVKQIYLPYYGCRYVLVW